MSIRRETMVPPTRTDAPALRRMLAGTTALTTAAVCGWLLAADPAWALPTDGTVVEGQAEIIYGTDSVTIQQGSDRVVIEWQTFDVGAHESVTFIQPHELAAALNRVLSGDASQILGSLSANGQVFISNPAGVVFGPDANVDVASIVATSLDIMNDRFMAGGRLDFDIAGDPTAVVENRGTINASGLAALVGPSARNSGAIVADVAILGGGEGFALDYYGDGLVNFAITDPTTQLPVDSDGNAVGALVENTGSIIADGGQVILTADVAAGVIDTVINLDGVVVAHSIDTRGGQVVLVGGDEGTVTVAGQIDATGDDDGEEGGTVHVLGDTVALLDGADIDVSGQAGGGTALIGGARTGGPLAPGGNIAYAAPEEGRTGTRITVDPVSTFETESYVPTADITYFDQGATANANATVDGDGGEVILWADEALGFYGTITADAGPEGGNGGFIETSSPGILDIPGSVSAIAVHGMAGEWLLDPINVTIVPGATTQPLLTIVLGDPVVVTASGVGALVSSGQLSSVLSGGTSVTIVTGATAAPDPEQDGDIAVTAAVQHTGADDVTLRLEAHDDIEIVSGASITATGNGALNVQLIADADGSGGAPGSGNPADIAINGAVGTNGGTFEAEAAGTFDIGATGSVSTVGSVGDVFVQADDFNISAGGSLDATGGTVTITRSTAGTVMLGDDTTLGGLHLTQDEVEAIDAARLVIGGGPGGPNNVSDISVENFDTTVGTITGVVELNALNDLAADVNFAGMNEFNGLHVRANDDINFFDFVDGATTTVDANAVLHADFDELDGNFDEIFFATSAANTLNVGGDLLMVLGAGNSGTNLDAPGAINVTGNLLIELSRPGRIGIGVPPIADPFAPNPAVDVTLSQAEIDAITAGSVTIGNGDPGTTHVGDIIFNDADMTGLGLVTANALNTEVPIDGADPIDLTPDVEFIGTGTGNRFDALTATAADQVRTRVGSDTIVDGNVLFDAQVVDIRGDLTSTTGSIRFDVAVRVDLRAQLTTLADNDGGVSDLISGNATLVRVLSTDAEIQDGIDVASDAGVNADDVVVSVPNGGVYANDSDGLVIDKAMTLQGNDGDETVPGAGAGAPRLVASGNANGITISSASAVAVSGMDISGYDIGILAAFGGGSLTVDNNTISAAGRGVIASDWSSVDVTYNDVDVSSSIPDQFAIGLRSIGAGIVSHNELTSPSAPGLNSRGILLTDFGVGSFAYLIEDNVIGDAPATGFDFNLVVESLFASTNVTIGGGNVITGGGIGARFDGVRGTVNIVGDTLNDLSFAELGGDFIQLFPGAEFAPDFPTVIDATGVNFDGLDPTSPDDLAIIEGRVVHFPDTLNSGLLDFGPLIVPEGVPLAGLPTDVETLLDEILGAASRTGDPGGAAFFTNPLGGPTQPDVFGETYALGGLQPAGGGGTNGPVNLADLEPAAGPGSEEAQAEDTCVETYFGDVWNVDTACQ